ncbi:tRNA (adenosine(37)-N6)-threonylcarbamoyltransferase complex transferase subunit TsaD [Candidatus Margulisiibacteriota bacterium]
MKILAIETSCDETSVAVVENGDKILSNLVSSQVEKHAKFGGVVPELASRMHTEKINLLLENALDQADVSFKEINACAVTYGPGLEGSLLVGLSAAKTLAHTLNIPFIGINHLHGHLYANFFNKHKPEFPFICLIVSGGHTILTLVEGHFKFKILGQTRDDAAGEAFDKIARYLDLGYPGGPIIEKQALTGNELSFDLPKPMLKQGYEFSFSGLKTATIQTVQHFKKTHDNNINIPDICASFQKTVIDLLLYKAFRACREHKIPTLVLSGGVIANKKLRDSFIKEASRQNIKLFSPEPEHCTDNASMIGTAAYYYFKQHGSHNLTLRVDPNASMEDII